MKYLLPVLLVTVLAGCEDDPLLDPGTGEDDPGGSYSAIRYDPPPSHANPLTF